MVEHSGLKVQEAQTAIEGYEPAARQARPKVRTNDDQADALTARFMAVEADGSLAQRARDVMEDKRSKAGKAST